jgi:hypothetical protein
MLPAGEEIGGYIAISTTPTMPPTPTMIGRRAGGPATAMSVSSSKVGDFVEHLIGAPVCLHRNHLRPCPEDLVSARLGHIAPSLIRWRARAAFDDHVAAGLAKSQRIGSALRLQQRAERRVKRATAILRNTANQRRAQQCLMKALPRGWRLA